MSFARKSDLGVWVELLPPCVLENVPLEVLRPGDDGELHMVVEIDHPTIHPGWIEALSPEQRAALGIAEISETLQPNNPAYRITGSEVRDVDGVPTRSWQTVAISIEEAKAAHLAAAQAAYDAKRQSPMPWNFGSILAKDDNQAWAGEAGEQTLQMRADADRNDLVNWLSAQAGAQALVDVGADDQVLALKTTDNLWVQTTAAQVLQVLVTGDGAQLSALQRGQFNLARFGAIKKAIADAPTTAAVLSIDVTAGYAA